MSCTTPAAMPSCLQRFDRREIRPCGAPARQRDVARRRVGASSALEPREPLPLARMSKRDRRPSDPRPGRDTRPGGRPRGSALPGAPRARAPRGDRRRASAARRSRTSRHRCGSRAGARGDARARRRSRRRHHVRHDHVAIRHRRRESPGRDPASRSAACGPTARRRCRPRPIPAPAVRSGRTRCRRP